MPKLCRINIERREEILEDLKGFVKELKEKLPVHDVFLYGSFARGTIHEGSDIDLVIVGDFKDRFVERIGKILEMTDLPIEPLVYTPEEFQAMQEAKNSLIMEVLKNGRIL